MNAASFIRLENVRGTEIEAVTSAVLDSSQVVEKLLTWANSVEHSLLMLSPFSIIGSCKQPNLALDQQEF